ncbi:nucleotidyltransferase domain-containing protein [Pasteurella sp. WM03]|uniref:nucleotidyltransferase domain-containing protein n=1 Tax=unclassified Pasteurella TaxID=2621516 RepID=UPI001FD77E0E
MYGSRAKGTYREGSNIDLCLKGKNLTHSILRKIWLDLDDSNSPYLFDPFIYHELSNLNLVENIDRIGKVFYQCM